MADVKTITYTTGYSDNIKDEVDDLIKNVAPTDTPFVSSIGKATCKTTSPDWLEDTLGDAAENAFVEGSDTDAVGLTPAERLTNLTQIMKKVFYLSGTLQASDLHGRSNELKYQSGKKTKELARDIEYNMLNNVKQTGNSSTARKLDGAFQWAHASNTYTFDDTPAATNHITEEILNDVMQSMWELGCDPTTVLAPPAQKRKISKFTDDGRLTINTGVDKKKITMTVRLIETDFGVVTVIPERFIAPTVDTTPDPDVNYDKLLIYDKSMFEVMTLKGRGLKREKLAKTGDGDKYHLITEKTLKCRTKKAVGMIDNLTRVKAA